MAFRTLIAIVEDRKGPRHRERIFSTEDGLVWEDDEPLAEGEFEELLEGNKLETVETLLEKAPDHFPKPVKVIQRPPKGRLMLGLLLGLIMALITLAALYYDFVGAPLSRVLR